MAVMSFHRASVPVNLKTALGLVALLGLLAILQYRWLGQVSEAEHERMRANLRTAITNFATDFDREIVRPFIYFHLNPRVNVTSRSDHLAERYRLWQDDSPNPGLRCDASLKDGGRPRLLAAPKNRNESLPSRVHRHRSPTGI